MTDAPEIHDSLLYLGPDPGIRLEFARVPEPLTVDDLLATVGPIPYLIRTHVFLALLIEERLPFGRAIKRASTDPVNQVVRRLSYNSPLEIVIGLGAGITVVTASANQILNTFTRYQRARVTKSVSDAQVEVWHHIRDHLDALGSEANEINGVEGEVRSGLRSLERLSAIALEPDRREGS